MADTSMTLEEAQSLVGGSFPNFYFIRDTSYLGKQLARDLRGGKKADPNVGPAIRTAEGLLRRLEALAVVRNLPPAPEPKEARPVPPQGDLPAMPSDARRDARYVQNLTQGGGGMAIGGNVSEALRVVRALRPKMETIWSIYETSHKPERVTLSYETQEAFWRKMDELAEEVVRS